MSTTSRPVRLQAADQGCHQAGPGHAAIAAHGHGLLAGLASLGAEGATQMLGQFLIQARADDATDVIGLENGRVNLHGINPLW